MTAGPPLIRSHLLLKNIKLNSALDLVTLLLPTALEIKDSAVVLGDKTLRELASEIADKVKKNVAICWTIRESTRAKLMVLVRRTLSKHGCPPDKQQKAVDTILRQAECWPTVVYT